MTRPSTSSRIRRIASAIVSAFGALAVLATATLATTARADDLFSHPKYASIVVDANTGEVLYALRADQPRVPASITKILTLYLAFEALETGRMKLNDTITVSPHAVSMIPVKSGLRAGEQLTVDEAIRLIAILSANDIAVAMGEHLAGGNEAKFAQLMTLRAQELGMTGSRFVNASGVPDPGNRQTTTARDIAILSRAVMRDYPQYYSFFSQKEFDFRGRHLMNHNHLLLRMPGVDGLKTGFTNAAGYNLAASALRDGRRLITVVLGGSSTAARDENVENLLSAGFQVLASRAEGRTLSLASALGAPDEINGAMIRPSADVGSGEQEGLRVAAAEPSRLPGAIDSAMLSPVALQPAALRTPTHAECETFRTTVMVKVRHRRRLVAHTVVDKRCHQSSAPAGAAPMKVIDRVVTASPPLVRAADTSRVCTGRGRHRVCRSAAARTETVASTTCTGRGRHRVCRAAPVAEESLKLARTCTGSGRHKVCRAAESDTTAVAAAKLRGCTGRAARRSKACRAAETEVAAASAKPSKASAHAKGRQVGVATARRHRGARAADPA